MSLQVKGNEKSSLNQVLGATLSVAWLLAYVGGGAFALARYAVANLDYVPPYIPLVILFWVVGYFLGYAGLEKLCSPRIEASHTSSRQADEVVGQVVIQRPFSPVPIITWTETIQKDRSNLLMPRTTNLLVPKAALEPPTATVKATKNWGMKNLSNYLPLVVEAPQFKDTKFELQSV